MVGTRSRRTARPGSATVQVASPQDIVDRTGLATAAAEGALRKLVQDGIVKSDRSLSQGRRPHPEDAALFTDPSVHFYRL